MRKRASKKKCAGCGAELASHVQNLCDPCYFAQHGAEIDAALSEMERSGRELRMNTVILPRWRIRGQDYYLRRMK